MRSYYSYLQWCNAHCMITFPVPFNISNTFLDFEIMVLVLTKMAFLLAVSIYHSFEHSLNLYHPLFWPRLLSELSVIMCIALGFHYCIHFSSSSRYYQWLHLSPKYTVIILLIPSSILSHPYSFCFINIRSYHLLILSQLS